MSSAALPLLRNRVRALAIAVVYVALYVLLDWISYILPVTPLGISPWNPPPGLSLVLLLLFGLRYWPALPVAMIAADFLTRGLPAPGPLVLASLCNTAVYTGCAAVLRQRLSGGAGLESLRDLAWLIGTTLPGTLLAALSYVGVFTLFGDVSPELFPPYFLRFWIGDLDGVLVIVPLLLILRGMRVRRLSRWASLEIAAQASVLAAAVWLVFREPNLAQFQLFYVLFLPLIWIVAKHGLPGAALALAVIQLGLIAVVPKIEVYASTFIRYQFLMTSLCVTGLALGSLESQRRRSDAALQEKNELLAKALQVSTSGELASALAHELNQPITAAANYVGACQLLLRTPDPVRGRMEEALEKAAQETRRAGEVLQHLRDFFRSGTTRLHPLQPAGLVQAVLSRLEPRAVRLQVQFELRASPGLPPVMADEVQIESLLHNLVVNSLDALEHAGRRGGRIVVTLEQEADHLLIAVEDDGPGVAPSVVQRLFQPFVTTKAEGMGLGLSISRTLAEAHGGTLVYRPAGSGGGFRLRLPISGKRNA